MSWTYLVPGKSMSPKEDSRRSLITTWEADASLAATFLFLSRVAILAAFLVRKRLFQTQRCSPFCVELILLFTSKMNLELVQTYTDSWIVKIDQFSAMQCHIWWELEKHNAFLSWRKRHKLCIHVPQNREYLTYIAVMILCSPNTTK